MSWIELGLALAAVAAAGVIMATAIGSRAWRRATEALELALTEGADPCYALDEIPGPLARYLTRAVPRAAAQIRVARLTQRGFFQMGEGPDGWRPFTATEVFRVADPGFYWDAKIEMAPLLSVRVRDSYVSGQAVMLGKILGLVTVVDAAGDPGLQRGAMSRYLAEAVWFPTRLASGFRPMVRSHGS
jgi:uncharacterized protein DUF6920